MTTTAHVPDAPPPELRFRRRLRLGAALVALWQARELVRTLAERDLRARYKQAVLGFAWSIITPLVLMVVFSVFVQRVAKIDTSPAPYALFTYLGLLPWTFFSSSISSGGQSLVANAGLLNKVYCPREVFPAAGVVVAAVDTAISTLILGILFVVFGFAPRATSVWILVLLPIQVAFTLGFTLALSSVLVYLRDLRHAIPIILQVGLFATPVAWRLDIVPGEWRGLYCALNPLAPVIDGYRRAVLYGRQPRWEYVSISAVTAGVVLVLGYILLKRLETRFADVA